MVRWTIRSEYWQDELPHSRPPIHLHSRMILRSPPQQNTSITALLCWRFNLYTFEMITWYPMDSVNLSLLAIHRRFLSVKVTFVISIKWKYGLYLMTTDGVALEHKVPLLTMYSGTYFRLYNVKFLTNICHELWQPHHITASWLTTPHRYNVCTPYNKQ